MLLSKNILSLIFGDANEFCGKEDVIHAIIYHRLLESGLSPTQVAREQPVSSSRIDVVVFDKQIQGKYKSTNIIPKLAIEVKGGAYGDRNALNDEITSDGYCKDMEKLEKEVEIGIESWFICVDMPELGRAVNSSLIKKIHAQCRRRRISFAYYCQGENHYYYAPNDANQSNEKIVVNNQSGRDIQVQSVLNGSNPNFNKMCKELLQINGHEANTTAALYHLFRRSGFTVKQLSLETYFSFAKKPGSSMHDRPDMVLFDKEFDGMFNLYKKGNRNNTNDGHKLRHIDTIFEVKGSATMNSKGDKARLGIYLEDIAKLHRWQAMAKENGCGSLRAYFVCLDGRKKGLPSSAVKEMFEAAGANPVVYISNGGIEFSAKNG